MLNTVNTQKSPPWACDKGCAEACAERFSALNLECGDCFARSDHFFLFLHQTKEYPMHHGAMETIWCFGMKYLGLGTSCLCLSSSSKSWVWIKILIIWAAVSSKGFKGATMLLVVSFISFFLFCHRTGQCIVRILNWKDSLVRLGKNQGRLS